MNTDIQMLDCTLRDGAYINNSNFGTNVIKGIIKKMKNANVDIIECGWLKNAAYVEGSTYFHVPSDMEQYIEKKDPNQIFVVMIDWDRYDLDTLPQCDGKMLDAIRVVFPHGRQHEVVEVAKKIQNKGYKVFLQAANTLAYSDDDLIDLANTVNIINPVSLSIVDTFGAMFEEDLDRIIKVLTLHLNNEIKLGFHSHNNMQLSFALTLHFISSLYGKRDVVVDSSLCGMGRGAGNATTELLANYLNIKYHKSYDMNEIMDAIDMYMPYFQENYVWGYSTSYFIAGMYQCHVNNIAYLQKNHRTNSKEMKNIIESLSVEERRSYDYNLLEQKYIENQGRIVDDECGMNILRKEFDGRKVLLIGPGKTTLEEKDQVIDYVKTNNPVVVFVNALNPLYKGDYLFLINSARYDYAKDIYREQFNKVKKILLSNIKVHPLEGEIIINFNSVIKRGWEHFDNAIITCLRLLNKLAVSDVGIAGFDGFKHKYNESYADYSLPTINPDNKWDELNTEIQDIFDDFKLMTNKRMKITFVTTSMFDKH